MSSPRRVTSVGRLIATLRRRTVRRAANAISRRSPLSVGDGRPGSSTLLGPLLDEQPHRGVPAYDRDSAYSEPSGAGAA
jgi:hypothetical protein